ncbi:MAG: peptide-methionine (S)-S-oxide reductase MsrA [Methanomicrobiales archaeon]|nr:peptide-methionine (S)-S-oxide reductase MsrA [Methanomicrobiales archaeon]
MTIEKAAFGAGCFWGVEAAFRQVRGVLSTQVGYMGGGVPHPTYEKVCTGATGHAEAVEVTFNPTEVTYETLLDLFWRIHDPTQLNRQGPDTGTNYRSVIFYHTPQQKAAAEASRDRINQSGRYRKPVVTEIVPASTFWRAEEYHQQYFEKRGGGRCQL